MLKLVPMPLRRYAQFAGRMSRSQFLRWLAVLMSEGGDPDASEKPEDQSKAGKDRGFKFSWQSQKSKVRTQEIEDLKKQLEQAHKDRS